MENACEIIEPYKRQTARHAGTERANRTLPVNAAHVSCDPDDCPFSRRTSTTQRQGFLSLTRAGRVRIETELYTAGQEEVDKLADRSGEYVHLVVENDGREVAIYERRGEHAVGMDYHLQLREAPQHLHDSASGKAIHSAPPRDVKRRPERLSQQTQHTITDRETSVNATEESSQSGSRIRKTNDEDASGVHTQENPCEKCGEELSPDDVYCPTSRQKGPADSDFLRW